MKFPKLKYLKNYKSSFSNIWIENKSLYLLFMNLVMLFRNIDMLFLYPMLNFFLKKLL